MCGRTSGKGGRSKNQEWWNDEVARAVDEKREVWKKIEKIRDRGEQPSVAMNHLYGRKKKAARRAVDKAKQKMEEELYKKLDEDVGKRMIYKMARDRNEESKDVKIGPVLKDNNGTLITDHKEAFKQHGLRVNLEKTEVLSIGAHREELNIKLEGRTIRQNNSFIYLGGAVSSVGRSETEVRRRVQAEANAWRQVEGVMSDRHISKKLKGKVLGACVTPAMLYGLDKIPVTEEHQHRLQVCENNWMGRIAGVKRVDRRRMDELKEEVGIQKCLMGGLVKSRMKWEGHVERMKEDRLPMMAYVHQERGKR